MVHSQKVELVCVRDLLQWCCKGVAWLSQFAMEECNIPLSICRLLATWLAIWTLIKLLAHLLHSQKVARSFITLLFTAILVIFSVLFCLLQNVDLLG